MGILFFVVLPLATILIAIVLQKLLRSPILVAILVFAVYLILAFTVFTAEFLINAIIYTLLAFITAVIVKIICCFIRRLNCNPCSCNDENSLQEDIEGLQNSIGGLERSIDSLENNISDLTNLLSGLIGSGNNGCGCNRRIR